MLQLKLYFEHVLFLTLCTILSLYLSFSPTPTFSSPPFPLPPFLPLSLSLPRILPIHFSPSPPLSSRSLAQSPSFFLPCLPAPLCHSYLPPKSLPSSVQLPLFSTPLTLASISHLFFNRDSRDITCKGENVSRMVIIIIIILIKVNIIIMVLKKKLETKIKGFRMQCLY